MSQSEKRSYQKPVVSRVKLAPQEAVIAGCKTASGSKGKGVGMKCTANCASAAGT